MIGNKAPATKVISFASGKGGVGKTSLSANLGVLWAQQGKRTLLVDGDWTLGKLGITLGVRPQWTAEQVLEGKVSIHEAVAPVRPGLSLLASPSGIIGFEEMPEDARMRLFYEVEALGHDYDLVIFDHSSGIDWGVLQFAAASQQHVIVTTPEPTSCTDAYAIMKILSKRFSIREFQLVVTMSHNAAMTERVMGRFSDLTRKNLGVRLNVLEILPWEPKMAESISSRRPYVERFPQAEFTARLQRLAIKIGEHRGEDPSGLQFQFANGSAEIEFRNTLSNL